jgi:hypothetical protein
MSEIISEVSKKLLSKHNINFVCNENTDLVLEGYPRSGNTFSVDFLFYQNEDKKLKIAHHTHDFSNLLLGVKLGVPCAVLIRAPLDAISSYMIYSNRNVDAAATYYYEFYSSVLAIKDSVLLIKFDDVVTDMNKVILQLNDKYNLNLKMSDDFRRDSDIVKERNISRAKKNNNTHEKFVKSVGAPSKERDLLKNKIESGVMAYLSENPHIAALYKKIISF